MYMYCQTLKIVIIVGQYIQTLQIAILELVWDDQSLSECRSSAKSQILFSGYIYMVLGQMLIRENSFIFKA